MNKKNLALYIVYIFLSLILLIGIFVFAGKLLKIGVGDGGDTEVSLLDDLEDEGQGLEDELYLDDILNFDDQVGADIDSSIIDNSDPVEDHMQTDDNYVEDSDDHNSQEDKIEDTNNKAPDSVDDREDPQNKSSEGVIIDVRELDKRKDETDEVIYGIDVAKWQGVIDWGKVKESGVDFAMIRVGYRTLINGEITEDPYGKYNLQQAQKNGLKIGVYFFSTAVNKKEAEEEAKWVAKFIAPYKITYPVVYNCEGFTDPNNRQHLLTKDERTNLAIVFLDYIKEKGYTPMFYASKNELENNRDWNTDILTKKYKIWVAQYPESINSESKSSYAGVHEMWQYTSNGNVPGIKGAVDLNVAYFGYENEAKAKEDTPIKEVIADPLALINFKEVNETITAKEVTNLRNIPGLDKDSKVIEVLYYGDKAIRIGIGDNGWSKVEYNGKTLYGVTSYLTTDLNYKDDLKPAIEDPEEGITFTKADEKVTAKIITNLRLVPNTDSDETIVVSLENGQIARRTGIGSNGWSRVEYEGQVLYAVTNYLKVVEEE